VQAIAAGALCGYRGTAVPLLIAVVGYWGIGFTGGWLLAFPAGYGPIALWSGLAAVALMLTVRLHFCAGSAALHKRLGAVPAESEGRSEEAGMELAGAP
jgi:MATE family multidrug resistance protein